MSKPPPMLERIARAHWERIGTRCTTAPWDQLPADARGLMVADAKATLEAMREPDERMIEAANGSGAMFEDDLDPTMVWQAMLDAVLEGK